MLWDSTRASSCQVSAPSPPPLSYTSGLKFGKHENRYGHKYRASFSIRHFLFPFLSQYFYIICALASHSGCVCGFPKSNRIKEGSGALEMQSSGRGSGRGSFSASLNLLSLDPDRPRPQLPVRSSFQLQGEHGCNHSPVRSRWLHCQVNCVGGELIFPHLQHPFSQSSSNFPG